MPTNPAAWSTPSYSRTQVDAAGAALIRERTSLDEQRGARVVVNDWRAAHGLPLERVRIESAPNDGARVRWNEYAEEERDEAIRAFEEVEAAIGHFPGADTVLVRVASVEALCDAYPSYFADTRDFVERLTQATG